MEMVIGEEIVTVWYNENLFNQHHIIYVCNMKKFRKLKYYEDEAENGHSDDYLWASLQSNILCHLCPRTASCYSCASDTFRMWM